MFYSCVFYYKRDHCWVCDPTVLLVDICLRLVPLYITPDNTWLCLAKTHSKLSEVWSFVCPIRAASDLPSGRVLHSWTVKTFDHWPHWPVVVILNQWLLKGKSAACLSHIIQTNQGEVTVWVVSGWWNTLAIPGCRCTASLPLQVNQSQRSSALPHPTREPHPNHLGQWRNGFWKWPLAIRRGTICSVCFLSCLPLKMSV